MIFKYISLYADVFLSYFMDEILLVRISLLTYLITLYGISRLYCLFAKINHPDFACIHTKIDLSSNLKIANKC